jgi:hypothetical protein
MRRASLLLAQMLAIGPAGYAQQQPVSRSPGEMTFGSASLVLGMPKTRAIQMLRDRAYRVDSTGNGDQWFVLEEHKLAGTLYFGADRLSAVTREWRPEGSTDVDAGRAVIEALLKLAPTDGCKVGDWSGSQPEVNMRAVAVFCGRHGIVIALTRSVGTEGFGVSEVLKADGDLHR